MLTQDQLEQLGVDVSAPAPAPAATTPDGPWLYGLDQAQRLGGRGLQAVGGALKQAGADGVGGWIEGGGRSIVEQQDKDIAAGGFKPQYPGGFLDQPGIGAKLGWLGEGIATNAASSIPALAGAAGAAVLAPTAPALAAGALALGGGTSFLMNAGESAQEFDDNGVSNDAAALGAGAVKTGLDLWGAKLAAAPFKAAGAKLAGGAATKAAERSATREVLGAAAGEGLTEGAQDTTDKAAAGMLGASYTPGEVAGGFLDSALIGGVLGGGTAAAGRVAARLTPEKAQQPAPVQPVAEPAMPDGVEPMSKEALDAARARMDADTARSEEARSMREGSAAAQENALVPYNEAGPWRRFSEAAGPGQTTDQGFRGGMLPGPAPDFIEGEILPPPAGLLGVDPRTGAEGFDVGGTYRGRAEPAEPVAPDAPRDLLALPAPGGPLTAAVRAEALYALPSRFGGPGLDQPVRGDARTPKRYLMPEQVDVRDPQAGNIVQMLQREAGVMLGAAPGDAWQTPSNSPFLAAKTAEREAQARRQLDEEIAYLNRPARAPAMADALRPLADSMRETKRSAARRFLTPDREELTQEQVDAKRKAWERKAGVGAGGSSGTEFLHRGKFMPTPRAAQKPEGGIIAPVTPEPTPDHEAAQAFRYQLLKQSGARTDAERQFLRDFERDERNRAPEPPALILPPQKRERRFVAHPAPRLRVPEQAPAVPTPKPSAQPAPRTTMPPAPRPEMAPPPKPMIPSAPKPAMPPAPRLPTPSIPASTPAPQPQPQEASHVQGQGQAEAPSLLNAGGAAPAAGTQPAGEKLFNTQESARLAAQKETRRTGIVHRVVTHYNQYKIEPTGETLTDAISSDEAKSWAGMDADARVAAAAKAGWSTAKGAPSYVARNIAKRDWWEIRGETRLRLAEAIRKPATVPPAAPAQTDQTVTAASKEGQPAAQAAEPAQPAAEQAASTPADTAGFTPTHELEDGTPVRAADEPNVWVDATGQEWVGKADPIAPKKEAPAPAPKSDVAEPAPAAGQPVEPAAVAEDAQKPSGTSANTRLIEATATAAAVEDKAASDVPAGAESVVEHEEAGRVEPASQSVVAESVAKMAKATGERAVEAGRDLAAEIDLWVAWSEKREGREEAGPADAKFSHIADPAKSGATRITFDVPGDGKFTVLEKNLIEFKKKVQSSAGFRKSIPAQRMAPAPSSRVRDSIEGFIVDGNPAGAWQLIRLSGFNDFVLAESGKNGAPAEIYFDQQPIENHLGINFVAARQYSIGKNKDRPWIDEIKSTWHIIAPDTGKVISSDLYATTVKKVISLFKSEIAEKNKADIRVDTRATGGQDRLAREMDSWVERVNNEADAANSQGEPAENSTKTAGEKPQRKPAAARKPGPAAEAPRKSDVAEPAPAADQPVEPAAEPVKAASEKPDETDKIARQPRGRAANPLQGAAPEGATNDTAGTTGSSEGDSQVDDGQRTGAGKAAAGSSAGARRGAGRADDRSVSGEGGGSSDATAAAGSDGAARKGAGAKVGGGADLARGDGRVSADFRPEPGGLTRSGSWLETASRNLDLIDLARKIESEGRNATAQEQAQLALYVGFGASEIRNRMFPVPGEYLRRNNPNRLIFPEAVEAGRWRSLAERAAALPEDWQRSILQVTQYQHFTSENMIRSIWSALQRLGFTGGKVFEPGTGIGSFRMLMPESVASTSKFTGIEFDGPTALIARLLSPEQNMLHGDFIKHRLPDDYFDVVIGNPPFSQTQVLADPRYQKHGFTLHDFFFAKSLDKLRPGGVLAFVTSKGTMDKKSDRARRYLADRADLLGAVRLPSTAFEGNAGTSVVTDVIFLRKRAPGDAEGGLPWRDVRAVETKDGPVVINEYFADNPGMVLGQNRISGNTDDEGRRINSNGMGGEKYTVVSYDKTPAELDARFARAVESLPEAVYRPHGQDAQSLRTETAKADFDPAVKREGVVYVKDGELMRVKDGVGVPLSGLLPKLSAKDTAWLKDYSVVRDLVREAQHAQITDGEWQDALKRLNAAYDDFVSKHGRFTAFRLITRKSTDEDGNVIEKQSRVYINRRLMIEDYDSPIVTQLESIDDDGVISKGPFLKGRSINAPKPRDVRTIGDALAVSLDEIGRLDLDDIARRLRISRDDAIDALGDQVFRTPQGEMQMADEYLSGNVVEKLAEAIEAARLDDSLRRNVEALEKAQPERLGPSQIGVKLGASWVPAEHVNEFASMIGAGYVTFDPKTESWAVEGGNKRSDRKVGAEYGTAARSPSELLEALLNSRSIKVMKTVPSDTGKGTKNVVDEEATTAANEMAGKIKSAFKSWVWTDSERAAALVETYNERFNNIAGRRFDGSHLTLPGVSLRFRMHAHQLRAIWRQIVSGNTYLAHAVGAGKTIEMIAGAMEQKRLGLIRKPMFVVPNHMLEQFANEFMELYPLANIMVADDKNFSAERRKEFTAAAALNNPDAIVITQSAFERVGVKEESIKPIRDEILEDLEDELRRTAKDNDSRVRRSQLEQQIEATKQRFDSILSVGQKDNVIPFEDLGVDMLYVDEAHAYRKLDFHTTQQIKGIDPNGSRRALDMYVKTRVLDRARPGRSFVFASGTPVTNTMGELYTVMRFFAPDTLDRDGTATFDSWARAYGDVVPALEQNASGKYEVVDRFARFENVPELMARVRQFMDVLQSEHLGAVVERPDIEGGKPQLIIVEPTAALKQYQEGPLSTRLATSRAWKPSFNQPNNPDPVLAIITDGRFAATDPRFIPGGEVRPGETTKMDRAADEIIAEYRATSGNVYVDRDGKPMPVKGGTQIVFYNVGFGAASGKKRGFDARAAFTRRLVASGIARDQIAWFDDADTDAKKEAIFKAMRAGTLRVLIGSAKKMGTGVNVQNRLTALHYMDPPWYPSDVEQPHGRIIRQRNQNKVVRIKWYATKGGYDATMWQMVGRKQRFIDQAFSGDKTLRSMDDLGESSQYEQAAALASGDPRALQLAGLRQDVERLERLHSAHANEQIKAKSALAEAERGEKNAASRIEIYRQMLKVIGGEHFTFKGGSVGRQSFDRYGEFGDAVKVAFNNLVREEASSPTQDEHQLATVGNGLKIIAIHDWQPGNDKEAGVRRLLPTGWFDVSVDVAGRSLSVGRYRGMGEDVDGTGLTRRIANVINGVDADLRAAESERQSRKEDVARLRKKVGAPFEHYAEMLDKHAALKELEEELRNEGAAAAQQAAAEVQPEGDTPDPGPETRFSRGAAVATPGTRGMPVSQVRRLANNLARTLGINPDSIVVHETTPDFLSGAGRVKGATDISTGAVHLVAGNLTGVDDALATLRHELIGHRGLRGVLRGAAWHNVMRATLAARGRDAAITRAMDAALREEFGAKAGAEQATFDGLDAAGRELLAEETIARAAEADVRTPVWQRIVGMIMRALRAVGLWRGAMNETEMRALLRAAQRGLRRQGQGRAERDGGADGLRYRRTATGNATLDAFYEKAGLGVGDGTVFERAQAAKAAALRSVGSRAWWAQRKDEAVQAMIDRFHGIKIAQREAHPGGLSPEQDGYISTRLTTSIGGVVDAVLLDGAPRWKDGILQKIDGSKGLLEALAPVGEHIDQWLGWMVARRAQRLMGEGREHNFTADEIDAGLKLARGHEAEFQKAADDYAKLKSAILDVAEQSGLIAGTDRATWDNLDYIPFYRMDDEGKALAMARGKRGIANQVSGIRRLMGGEQGLNDPLDNIIRNFASLLDRSAKNAAMDLTMRNLAGTRFVTPVPSTRFTKALVPLDQFRKMLRDAGTDMDAVPDAVLRGVQKVWALEAPTDEDVVSVMRDGRKEYFRVNDPLLLRSLTSLRESPMRSIALDIARGAKNVLTHAVTVTPAFQLRNFIRDSAHSWIVGGKEFKPFDSIKGLSDALRNTGLAQSMKFAGASFEAGAFGDYDASVVAKHVRRRLGADKAGPFMATVHRLGDVWEKYRDFRGAVENANREAVAKATLRETGSMKAAMFAAKDAMDFSMRGDSLGLRLLTDTVPFLNARIQGLYKLGRSANMGSFAARAALMTVASLALLAWNRDDERWKRLEDWDRWGFWHFWLGDTHMRVPKPFEVGLLFSTWPEAAAQSLMGDDRRFWAAIRHGVQDTLRVDMPQLIGPAYEVATNEDRYTGRPVENLADQGKASSLRYSSRTSDTARALGQTEVFGARLSDATGLSPKELEHLFEGYFGEVGRWALDASDALVRAWSDAPARSDMRVRDVPLVGSLVASVVGGGADAPSKYATRVYEAIRESEAAYKSLRTMAQQGEPAAKIADFRRAHAEELAAYRALNHVQERDGEMRKMQETIRLSRTISPDAKRARVDAIEVRRQELMRSTYLNRVAALGY